MLGMGGSFLEEMVTLQVYINKIKSHKEWRINHMWLLDYRHLCSLQNVKI